MAVDLNSFYLQTAILREYKNTFANLSRTSRLSFTGVSC